MEVLSHDILRYIATFLHQRDVSALISVSKFFQRLLAKKPKKFHNIELNTAQEFAAFSNFKSTTNITVSEKQNRMIIGIARAFRFYVPGKLNEGIITILSIKGKNLPAWEREIFRILGKGVYQKNNEASPLLMPGSSCNVHRNCMDKKHQGSYVILCTRYYSTTIDHHLVVENPKQTWKSYYTRYTKSFFILSKTVVCFEMTKYAITRLPFIPMEKSFEMYFTEDCDLGSLLEYFSDKIASEKTVVVFSDKNMRKSYHETFKNRYTTDPETTHNKMLWLLKGDDVISDANKILVVFTLGSCEHDFLVNIIRKSQKASMSFYIPYNYRGKIYYSIACYRKGIDPLDYNSLAMFNAQRIINFLKYKKYKPTDADFIALYDYQNFPEKILSW